MCWGYQDIRIPTVDNGVFFMQKSKIGELDDSHKGLAMLKEVLFLGYGFVVIFSIFSDRGEDTQVYKA